MIRSSSKRFVPLCGSNFAYPGISPIRTTSIGLSNNSVSVTPRPSPGARQAVSTLPSTTFLGRNVTTLPAESFEAEAVRLAVTQQVAQGEWSVEEAAESVGFSPQSVRRWVSTLPRDLAPELPEVIESGEAVDAVRAPLDESVRKVLDDVMLRRPHLRRRSLQEYVRRHHGLDLPRRVVAEYLREKGLCGPAVGTPGNTGSRRFEAAAPLELIQTDLVYIRRKGGGFFYGLSVLDDHSRMILGVPVLKMRGDVDLLQKPLGPDHGGELWLQDFHRQVAVMLDGRAVAVSVGMVACTIGCTDTVFEW